MTSIFSTVLLALYTSVLQHAQQSTQNGKEQCECANNKVCNKAVLLFGFADFCLMYVVVGRLLTPSNPTTGFYRI